MSAPEQRSRRDVLRAVSGLGIASVAGCTGDGGTAGDGRTTGADQSGGSSGGDTTASEELSGTATVFHAGSLSAPFQRVEAAFEGQYDVQVNREAKGSVGSTKKITEQGRSADVLGVSDFRLVRDVVMGEFTDWYGIFTTNAMTIAYTDASTGADEFSTETWWEVLARDDVTFGHSDPAIDPNGYRSVMAMKLGSIPFEGETLFDESTSRALIEKAKIPAGTETDLLAQMESGALDYAWQYRSAGESHDVNVVDLQPAVNLAESTSRYAEHYAKATVEAGRTRYTGAPIAYGITVPNASENPEAGAAWIEFVTTDPGKRILEENGFSPVQPMVAPASAESEVPRRVAANATFRANLGPLEL